MTEPEKIVDTLSDNVKSTVESVTEPSLADRVETARVRSTELASNATKTARDFVHDHPVATIAGGIAIGALFAGAFARSLPTRTDTVARKASADVNVISDRLSHLASIGADLAMAYAARVASASRDGAGKLEDRFNEHMSQLNNEAGKQGAEASRKAAGLADAVINSLRDSAETALSRMNKYIKD
ncbi:hypothetical protein [Novosphingobium sp.]|uniref:hypothetical protein n=1 Tax=Novosphingobium sp. TaxID=1874826 RepID=UPI003D0BEC30